MRRSAIRWGLIGGLATVAFLLGYVGFRQYFDDIGAQKSTTDLVDFSLQLFTLESGSVPDSGAPWQLEVARLAAPLATATALLNALIVVFESRFRDWRLQRARQHVIVCGLGWTGANLVRDLLEHGHEVVVIEANEQNPAVESSRRRGATLTIGEHAKRRRCDASVSTAPPTPSA